MRLLRPQLLLMLSLARVSSLAQTTVAPAAPRISAEVVAGGAHGHAVYRPTARIDVGLRLGPARRLAPVLGLELAAIGSGYKSNVGQVRPDGSSFEAPALLGGPAASIGLQLAPGRRVLLGTAVGVARLEPGEVGYFINVDAVMRITRSAGVVAGLRRMSYYDPHMPQHRAYTPVVFGLRLSAR